jgi:hypothetical protein
MSARMELNVLRSTPIEKLHREFHMCQNCIRLIEKPADSCVCGADHYDICDCIDCMRSVHFLIDGEYHRTGVCFPIKSWTPDGGVVLR